MACPGREAINTVQAAKASVDKTANCKAVTSKVVTVKVAVK